jgi:hypothetical protein
MTPPEGTTVGAPPPRSAGRRWLYLGLAAGVPLAVLTVATYWFLDTGNRLFFPRKWGVVEEGRIYRSGMIHRRLIEDVLKEHRIATIVNLSELGPDAPDLAAEREAAARLGVRMVDAPGLEGDGRGEVGAYAAAVTELARATRERPVLVHCVAGSERTGASVAAYRMLVQGWDGARTYAEYLSYRRRPPEDDRLRRFVNEHLGELARRLVEAGVLDRVPDPLPVFAPADG